MVVRGVMWVYSVFEAIDIRYEANRPDMRQVYIIISSKYSEDQAKPNGHQVL